ncbi:DUF2381 family protein [Stigmatella aurantiaca]|uniref:Conserved uncharacterized protein n=1 Tax=Stigmatella aurantiaca (strain DW4/3-1) TaxID=378806 RepID=Q08ZA8_STIAD|nr:DUF2381 family protein [Stigmatella aurantiaca]ADO73914.1 conserved uncharacterized protein [Stigmatella aurantiaca DW4/3-1]EAU65806.1 hypothetical protein STIAU_6218 [Stigmatella aurantiaca DW4/3-1]
MDQPLRLSLALALLWGAVARAEPTHDGGRVERLRAVTLASNPADPLPEVHVAGDKPTVLVFPAPIQAKTLTFDESRIRVLEAGALSVLVQAVTDLKEGERHEIGVFFADGRAPSRAAFVLVTHPSEVDARIDVQRPEPPAAPCSTESQPRVPLPEDFVLLGYVGDKGVSVLPIKDVDELAQGFAASEGKLYFGKGWALVSVRVRNRSTHPKWTPREATFTRSLGPSLKARLVMEGGGMIEPGEFGRALAVVDMPNLNADTFFTLEVRSEDGRSLKIPDVRFPKAVKEGVQ